MCTHGIVIHGKIKATISPSLSSLKLLYAHTLHPSTHRTHTHAHAYTPVLIIATLIAEYNGSSGLVGALKLPHFDQATFIVSLPAALTSLPLSPSFPPSPFPSLAFALSRSRVLSFRDSLTLHTHTCALSLSRSLSRWLVLFKSLSPPLSLSHTHIHYLRLYLSHPNSLSLSISLSPARLLSLKHTHFLFFHIFCAYAFSLQPSLSLSLTFSPFFSCPPPVSLFSSLSHKNLLSLARSLSLSLSLSLSRSLDLPLSFFLFVLSFSISGWNCWCCVLMCVAGCC